MTIYYLLIKTHRNTGLKYLCQTTRKDYQQYTGSGKYWKDHIKVHGKFIETRLLKECTSREELTYWGIYYSNLWNIVDSKDEQGNKLWANLTFEAGTGGKTTKNSPLRGKITVKDKNGNTFLVNKKDQRLLTGELVSINKGTIIVSDKNGKRFRVNKDDPRVENGTLLIYGPSTNKVTVVDSNGNTFSTNKTDVRFINGEVNHIFKGKITVKDSLGNYLKISTNDPRYISGEVKAIATGVVSVIDNLGNSFKVNVDDPRYISGELKFYGGPKKGTPQKKVTCPYCNKVGGQSNMTRHHFNNCYLNPRRA